MPLDVDCLDILVLKVKVLLIPIRHIKMLGILKQKCYVRLEMNLITMLKANYIKSTYINVHLSES